jgi:hypothetical protein
MSRRFRARLPAPLLALLLAAGATAAGAADEHLGRLFHTPEQRRQLDQQRTLGASRPGLEERPTLRLDGVLRHPDGRLTTWINGRPAEAGRLAPGQGPEQAHIVTGAGKSVAIRVGEALPADGSATQGLLGDGHAQPDTPPR